MIKRFADKGGHSPVRHLEPTDQTTLARIFRFLSAIFLDRRLLSNVDLPNVEQVHICPVWFKLVLELVRKFLRFRLVRQKILAGPEINWLILHELVNLHELVKGDANEFV